MGLYITQNLKTHNYKFSTFTVYEAEPTKDLVTLYRDCFLSFFLTDHYSWVSQKLFFLSSLMTFSNLYLHVISLIWYNLLPNPCIAQSAGAVEYTDCTSAEG